MAESSNSSSASGTPTFSADRYSVPTWTVKVNGILNTDAILQNVEIGFGSDISTASFFIPKDPATGGLPIEGDLIDITVNSNFLFKGKIKVKNEQISSSGLRVYYTCSSNITDLNNDVILDGAFNSAESHYPTTLFNAPAIFTLSSISASNVPNKFPGVVNITDQTKLQAAESILGKIGNYKLYYDMQNSNLSVYTLGGGGVNTRSFITGKNIIDLAVLKSTENIVDKVIVVGSPTQTTSRVPVVVSPQVTADGRLLMAFSKTGTNIRDIVVEGQTREKPIIKYDPTTPVPRKMVNVTADGTSKYITRFKLPEFNANTTSFTFDDTTKSKEDNDIRYPIIVIKQFPTDWTTIPTELVYSGKNSVQVFLSEVPKQWYAVTFEGEVSKYKLKLGDVNSGNTFLQFLEKFDFTTGSLRVTYTVDGSRPTATTGSGKITRSFTDSQYQIISNNVTGFNNSGVVLNDMLVRANAELNKLKDPTISGNITVLGDETITLKHTIIVSGEKLDILHISHDFTSGFTTTVTLTNETLQLNAIPTVILEGSEPVRNRDNEKGRRRELLIQNVSSDILRKKSQQLESEQKSTQEPPRSGPHTLYK